MSSYDQNLLNEAPRATRAQLQEGYNVDLLEQPPRRTPSMRTPQTPHPQPLSPLPVPLTPIIPETASKEKFGSPAYVSAQPNPRTSFWRTRNGIITIAVLVLVVVGAVVGGAVGGTVGKNSSSKVVTPSSSASPSSTLSPTSSSPSPPPSTTSGAVAGQGSESPTQAGVGNVVPAATIPKAASTAGSSQQNIVD